MLSSIMNFIDWSAVLYFWRLCAFVGGLIFVAATAYYGICYVWVRLWTRSYTKQLDTEIEKLRSEEGDT